MCTVIKNCFIIGPDLNGSETGRLHSPLSVLAAYRIRRMISGPPVDVYATSLSSRVGT